VAAGGSAKVTVPPVTLVPPLGIPLDDVLVGLELQAAKMSPEQIRTADNLTTLLSRTLFFPSRALQVARSAER
jgi:hypothetical protein